LTSFVTVGLGREHDRDGFRSGVEALDRYLRELALQDMKRRVAGCFVALGEGGEVAGFYALAATSVPLDLLPAELGRKLPRYPVIPAMLLGRLAVATRYRGQGLGRALIADAALRTDRFRIGACALIVDAKDERAGAFYAANGLVPIPDDARRMFLPMATAVRASMER
jgi:GNAT superfamily N-acetyltransferase